MSAFIAVFESSLRPIESRLPGYYTLLDALKAFNFYYTEFKYPDAAKFSLDPRLGRLLMMKFSTIANLETCLKTIITWLFVRPPSQVSPAFLNEIEARMQLIIVISIFVQLLSASSPEQQPQMLSRRFISSSLNTFRATGRIYEVLLSSYYLADEGFLMAFNHFSGDFGARDEGRLMSGIMGFFLLLCFESFTPAVREFLHTNLQRLDEVITLKPQLSPFAPFSSLLKGILALSLRADQCALDYLLQFHRGANRDHPLMGYLYGFLNLTANTDILDLTTRIIKRFGAEDLPTTQLAYLEPNSDYSIILRGDSIIQEYIKFSLNSQASDSLIQTLFQANPMILYSLCREQPSLLARLSEVFNVDTTELQEQLLNPNPSDEIKSQIFIQTFSNPSMVIK